MSFKTCGFESHSGYHYAYAARLLFELLIGLICESLIEPACRLLIGVYMEILLSDPVIEVKGWTPDLDRLGEFDLRIRKTPEELREEREILRDKYGPAAASKLKTVKFEHHSVISKNPDDSSIAYFLPGLWPRIKRFLDAKQVAYNITDKRNPEIRPPLDLAAFKGVQFRSHQDLVIAAIAASDCGIIETPTAMGKSFCIALLCKAFPTLNIVITTSSTQVVATLYEYLCKTVPDEVGMLCSHKNNIGGKRVIVTTLKSLVNIPREKVHLVLVDECHSIGYNQAGKVLMEFCFARRFGFSASPIRNDGAGLAMESILGPVIVKMEYQEAVDAAIITPMKYMMLPCSSCPDTAKLPDLPEFLLKRMSYWCNYSRNRAIKNFVYDLKKVYDGQILIMVSTLEHAIHLHKMLPWFTVAYYGKSDLKYMQSKFPDMDLNKYKLKMKELNIIRNAFAKGSLRYVISTKVFKQGVNFCHLSCLIRADGDVSGIEGIQIPGRLSRLDDNKEFAYLVDIDDLFSPWAHNRSTARQALYERQKWQQISYGELINDLGNQTKNNNATNSGQSGQ